MKQIAVLTSGGDAPGMNAAVGRQKPIDPELFTLARILAL